MSNDYELPFIQANDYGAFRRLMNGDIPDTYDEWLKLIAKRRREEAPRRDAIRDIQVDPDEFARYCDATGQRCNNAALTRFTIEKARRKP